MKKYRHYYTALHRYTRSKGFGIHSPFAFNFILRVLRERNHYYAYTGIKRRRKQAYALTGSLSNNPKVISYRNAKLLFRITCYFTPGQILQIGTAYGVTTTAMLDVSSSSHITVCPCGNPYKEIYDKITERFKSRIEIFDTLSDAYEHYITLAGSSHPFVLINFMGEADKDLVIKIVKETVENEGLVIIRNLSKVKEQMRLWIEVKKMMNHGMSFSNDHTTVIVGLNHLPLQHFNIMF